MSVHESYIGFLWLESVLGGDSTLAGYAPGGVWRGEAPPNTPTPFVVMAQQAGVDTNTINAFRLLVEMLYQVKAVGPASSTATIASAASRIDALIGKPPTSGSVAGGYVGASFRESPLMIDEIVNGEQWTTIGGLYRLEIQQTS
jgi:hypothetical protein